MRPLFVFALIVPLGLSACGGFLPQSSGVWIPNAASSESGPLAARPIITPTDSQDVNPASSENDPSGVAGALGPSTSATFE